MQLDQTRFEASANIIFMRTIFLLVICCFAQLAAADESPEQQLRRQMDALQSELEQLRSQAGGLMPALPATPQDKLKLVIDSINRNYVNLRQNLYAGSMPETNELIPVPYASRLSGHIEVHGVNTQTMQRAWKSLELKYTVREAFIGYLITTRYFNTHSKKFTDKKDYHLASISTDIRVQSFAGRQCVAIRSGGCAEWASFAKAEIDKDNHYPSLYDWVVMGSSENGVMSIEIASPDVLFSSAGKRAVKGLGCFGATLKMDAKDFRDRMRELSLSETAQVGTVSAASDCNPGSRIEMHIDFCDQTRYADLNACRQVAYLFGSLKQSLALRDAYQRWGGSAQDVDQLHRLVTQEISTDYPLIDLQDDNFLDNNSATFQCGAIHIPELCNKCIPKPLCKWEREALMRHEENHQQTIAAHADYNTLMCGTTEDQMRLYPDANARQRAEAKALADMEYKAYTEQARYLNDIIEQQLHGIFDCSLSPGFLLDYPATQRRLNPP